MGRQIFDGICARHWSCPAMLSRSQGRYSAVPPFQLGLKTAPRRPPLLRGQRSNASTALRVMSQGPAVGGVAGKPGVETQDVFATVLRRHAR